MQKQQSWERIFACFRKRSEYKSAKHERRRFRNMKPLRKVLETVAECKYSDGTFYEHLQRISKQAIEKGKDCLLQNEKTIGEFDNFHSLHQFITALALSILGLGKVGNSVAVYDWSIGIGAHLRLSPTFVYLHAETKTGAMRIRPKLKVRRIDNHTRYLARCDLPKSLRDAMWTVDPPLEMWELEDIFCIFRDEIGGLYATS